MDKILKRGVFLLLLFISNIFASTFVLNHSGLLDIRAIQKINEIGSEVKLKLGVNLYVDVKGDNGIDPSLPMKQKIPLMKEYEKNLVKTLHKPFVLVALSLDQMYINLLFSDDKLARIVNKDDILDGYIIPLLASKDKNTLKSKVSAAILNGYSEIADKIAKSKQIKLVSNFGGSGKTVGTIWKVFIYTVVLSGIILFTIIILREKKQKGSNNG